MNEFFSWSGIAGTIFGFVGMVFSWLALYKVIKVERFLKKEKKRLSEKITLVLTDGKNKRELTELRRQDITRNEIQGRLGAIPIAVPVKKKSNRYSIEFLPKFYEQIDRISEGSSETGESTLTITCTPDEFSQFDFGQSLTNEDKAERGRPKRPKKQK